MKWLNRLRLEARKLKSQAGILTLALKEKRTPIAAKLLAGLSLVYLLSPIDLIPDFIPVLGLLDDILLIPFLLRMCLALIPKNLRLELQQQEKQLPAKSWIFALPIILLYILVFQWLISQWEIFS